MIVRDPLLMPRSVWAYGAVASPLSRVGSQAGHLPGSQTVPISRGPARALES